MESSSPADSKLTAQVQEQAKQLDEQEAMIKTLNKQLTHCESDLQAHMDMVARLETSLADSEKNREYRCLLSSEFCPLLIDSSYVLFSFYHHITSLYLGPSIFKRYVLLTSLYVYLTKPTQLKPPNRKKIKQFAKPGCKEPNWPASVII